MKLIGYVTGDEEVKIYSDKNKYFVKVENEYKALGNYMYLKDYFKNRNIEIKYIN